MSHRSVTTILSRCKSSTPSTLKELDPIVLDEIFQKNRSHSSFRKPLTTTQGQDNDLSEIDKNLKNFKANIPINFKYYLRNLSNLNNFKQLPYKFGDNQLIPSPKEKELRSILWDFNAPIRYSFGYGSGVFSQGKDNTKPTQIDLNFIVTYPNHWHSLNLSQFPQHYSFLQKFGSSTISKIQDFGAGVYFNPYVKDLGDNKQNLVKYGISSMDNLTSDLINWDTLYLSGRLHKPTLVLRNSSNVALLQNFNLINAIKLSLVLLDRAKITEYQLYEMIASLSYNGDPRMKVGGENPNKVRNIVTNQLPSFRKMYLPLLETYFSRSVSITHQNEDITFDVDLSPEFKVDVIAELPKNFRKRLFAKYATKFGGELSRDPISQFILNPMAPETATQPHLQFKDLQQVTDPTTVPRDDYEYLPTSLKRTSFIDSIARSEDLNYNLNKTLQEIIFRPALVQSLKGILTAGFIKSFDYALEKRLKYNKSVSK